MRDEGEPQTQAGNIVAAGASTLDVLGGVLGLLVFVVGVAVVLATYRQASVWYHEIGPAIEAARTGAGSPSGSPVSPKAERPNNSASDTIGARPGGPPIAKIALEFGLRLVWLVLMALLGFLLSVMGARLAGAHRGKRT